MVDTPYFEADHWSKIDTEVWGKIAPNFSPKELASNGNQAVKISKSALMGLQKVRDLYNKPLRINSAYRDVAYNKKIGGEINSKHTFGIAFDIHIESQEMGRELEKLALSVGFTAIGRYNNFIHIDMRPPKVSGGIYQWGTWK